jgi:hypothetical protein
MLCADGWHPAALGLATIGTVQCTTAGDIAYTCRRDNDGTAPPGTTLPIYSAT